MTAKPPDKYLQFILNLLYHQMLDKSSRFYLPKIIVDQSDPTYEPYTIDGEWALEKSEQLRSAGCAICFATAPDDASARAAADAPAPAGNALCPFPDYLPVEPPSLTLASPQHVDFKGKVPFQIAGLSNVTPGQPIVTEGETAVADAAFATIADWQHADGILLTGNFTIAQPCCMSDDGLTCKPGGKHWNNHGFGTFSALLKKAKVHLSGTAYSEDDSIQMKIGELQFDASVDTGNLEITATVLSISDPKVRESWEKTLQLALDATETRAAIVTNIKTILNSPGVRGDFQKQINDVLKRLGDGVIQQALASAPEEIRRLAPKRFL